MRTVWNKKPCYEWTIALACVLLSAASVGLLLYMGALFVSPVTQDLGVSRASFMMFSTIATVTMMIFLPFAGLLYKKVSMRLLIMIGACLGTSANFVYSLSNSVFGFYAGAVLAGIGSCLFGSIPISLLIANWFDEKRGMMTGIAFTGSGIIAFLLSPLLSELISQYGWRFGYRVIAFSIFAVTIPTALFLVRERPDSAQASQSALALQLQMEKQRLIGFTKKQAFGSGTFWFFVVAVFLIGMVIMPAQQQLVAYWIGEGRSHAIAARMYSTVMLTGIFSKILLGVVYDKAGIRIATIICCLIASASFLGLIFFTNSHTLFVPAVLFGITVSIQVIIPTYLTNKLFGNLEYSSIFGIITTVLFLGVSVGIPFSAFLYDSTGTYKTVWFMFSMVMVAVLVAILFSDRLSRQAFKNRLGIERPE